MRKIIFGLLFLLCLSAAVSAQDDATETAPHPIDAAMNKCLKTHKGNLPRAECYSATSEAWEKDVTSVYAKLLAIADAPEKAVLAKSQRAWEQFRDAEFEFYSRLYNSRKGTGYISVRITTRMEIVKTRALQLESHLESLNAAHGKE